MEWSNVLLLPLSPPAVKKSREALASAGKAAIRRVSVNGRQSYPSNGRSILFDSVIVPLGRGALILHRLFWLWKPNGLFIRGRSHNDFPFLVELKSR